VVALLEPTRAPAVVYGTITVGAVIAAEGTTSTTSSLGAVERAVLVLYWLATPTRPSRAGWRTGPVVDARRASPRQRDGHPARRRPALLVILVAWLLGPVCPMRHGGIYTSIAMLILLEIFAGIRIKLTGWALAGQAMVARSLVAGSSWCESSWPSERRFSPRGRPRPGTNGLAEAVATERTSG